MTTRLPLTRGRVVALVIGMPVTVGPPRLDGVQRGGPGQSGQLPRPPERPGHRPRGQAGAGPGRRRGPAGFREPDPGERDAQREPGPAGLPLAPDRGGPGPGRRCPVPTGNCTLDFHVTAPGGLPLNVSGSSGDLDVSGFRGQVTLSDGSGNLSASAAGRHDLAQLRFRRHHRVRADRRPGAGSATAPATSTSPAWPPRTWSAATIPATSRSRSPGLPGG